MPTRSATPTHGTTPVARGVDPTAGRAPEPCPRPTSRTTARRGRPGTGEQGSDLVEFGLLLLPLMLLLFGAIEGGRFLWTYQQVSDAARQGARYGIANFSTISSGSDPNVTTAAKSTVDGTISSSLTVTTTKQTSGADPYVEVTTGVLFQPATGIVPFRGTIQQTARMYVP